MNRKQRVGLKKEEGGNTAHNPSLNSSERRVANEEMRRRGELQKQMCAQDPSGSQILSVWAKTLFCSRCCLSLVAVWLSLPLLLTKPQAMLLFCYSLRARCLLSEKEPYENQLIPLLLLNYSLSNKSIEHIIMNCWNLNGL